MNEHPIILLILLPLAGYVIGATPFGAILGWARGIDLRKAGSGNVGATNVARVLGRPWGYLCFVLDLAKGLIPVAAAGWILRGHEGFPTLLDQACWLGVACGAVLGHVFTFWLKFRGGKGVATSLGAVLGLYPYLTWAGLAALGVWIAVTLISRYVSLGSIVAALAFVPLFVLFHRHELALLWPMAAFAAVMVALIVVRHRGNIRRLLDGTESKIRKS